LDKESAMPANRLMHGDNLAMLRQNVTAGSVDLIYLDPPFNSQADYHLPAGEQQAAKGTDAVLAFDDTWRWDPRACEALDQIKQTGGHIAQTINALQDLLGQGPMLAYLAMMAPRLVELHRVLKASGSLYLHCDPSASHCLRVLLDAIFGPRQFRNEIVWRRAGAHGPRRCFGPVHDVLLFYTKTGAYYFRSVRRPYMRGHVASRYRRDHTGRLRFVSGGNVLTGASATGGESGKPWRGFDPAAKNRHWAIPGFLVDQMPKSFRELSVLQKLDVLYEAGLIEILDGAAWPTPVRYLTADSGQPIQDVWAYQPYTKGTVHGTREGIDEDVAWLGPTDPERLGYPTQKPVGLLKRVIRSSCPEGGVVLDPFCGCGTTLEAAQRLGRTWMGIDLSALAIDKTRTRLQEVFSEADAGFELINGIQTLPH
jgi:site-specific DNA-methyltransferase (adenine-specific)